MITKLPINIDTLLHQQTIEGERIEYKADWNPKAVLHSMCAFANDFHNFGGGYIVIGVEEKNGLPVLPPKGISPKQIDTIQKEVLNLGNHAIQPHYHPLMATYKIKEKTILVLWTPGGETRPYKAKTNIGNKPNDWGFYIRKGSSTIRAKGDDEKELLTLTATIPFDDRYNQQASLDDLSPHLIEEFLKEVGSELATSVRDQKIEVSGRQINIIGGPSESFFPKNVGLLFFSKNPHTFFPQTQIDVVYFPDGAGGDLFEEKIFQGPLARITQDAISFIERSYLKETVIKHPDKPEAERFWNFPQAAIEEAVVNAVYHRSYEEREPIEVRITPKDLVVLSFPGPDRSINMNDLRKGKAVSRRYRNRRIGEFLKELELTEGRSTGIPKILRVMKKNGSPLPQFESDEDRTYFLIRLPVHKKTPLNDVLNWGKNKDQTGTKLALSQHQVLILEKCRDSSTLVEIMALTNRSDRTKFRNQVLNPLLNENLIKMTIPDKPRSSKQRYQLTNKGHQYLDHSNLFPHITIRQP